MAYNNINDFMSDYFNDESELTYIQNILFNYNNNQNNNNNNNNNNHYNNNNNNTSEDVMNKYILEDYCQFDIYKTFAECPICLKTTFCHKCFQCSIIYCASCLARVILENNKCAQCSIDYNIRNFIIIKNNNWNNILHEYYNKKYIYNYSLNCDIICNDNKIKLIGQYDYINELAVFHIDINSDSDSNDDTIESDKKFKILKIPYKQYNCHIQSIIRTLLIYIIKSIFEYGNNKNTWNYYISLLQCSINININANILLNEINGIIKLFNYT